MPSDLFANAAAAVGPLTVFRAELIGQQQTSWESLFAGFTAVKAITFSSSIEFLMRLVDRLEDAEIVFGSEAILSREHLALLQASQTVQAYGFADALADQKALVEALSRLLGRSGRVLLERVAGGTLRFRLLRGRPSHEKLYLLSGPAGRRVVTGSANLSLAAFEGRQHEIYVAFDGEPAWALFDGYYQRDGRDSVPVEPDALVSRTGDGIVGRTTPLALDEVPIVRVLQAGVALIDPPPRPVPAGFATDALRNAAAIGAELKELALPKDKAGRTVVNAATVLRVIRAHATRPLTEATEDRIPRAEIDFATGTVLLSGQAWLLADPVLPADSAAADARIWWSISIVSATFSATPRRRWRCTGLSWSGCMPRRRRRGCGKRRCRSASIRGCIPSMPCCMAVRAAAKRCSPGSLRGRCSVSRR
ncbi:MAG TPA: phospholipase D family protein [Acetobacteraceae bacterium]